MADESLSWGEAWKRYLKTHCAIRHVRSSTARATQSCGMFVRWMKGITGLEDFPVSAVTRGLLEQYAAFRRHNDISAWTIRGDHGKIAAFLRWCKDGRVIRRDPSKSVELPRVRRRFPDIYRPEHVRVLARHLRSRGDFILADYLLALVNTGGRPGEILTLKAEDVDIRARRATFRIREYGPKDGEERAVPLNRVALVALKRRLEAVRGRGFLFSTRSGRPLDRRNVLRWLQRASRRLELPKLTLYLMRHSMATHAAAKMPERVLAKILGHADPSTTARIYTHLEQLNLPAPPVIA